MRRALSPAAESSGKNWRMGVETGDGKAWNSNLSVLCYGGGRGVTRFWFVSIAAVGKRVLRGCCAQRRREYSTREKVGNASHKLRLMKRSGSRFESVRRTYLIT